MLLTSLVAVAACAPPPPTAQPDADRPRYELNVRVTRPFRIVTGDLTVTFTPNRPTDRLVFRLWPNGPLQRGSGSRLDAGPVTADGTRLLTQRPDPTTLIVRLEGTLASGSAPSFRCSRGIHAGAG